ncbi:MAG: XrtA/PEP-CTERM system TPR-repeat protein PrsT [Burkholderiaceae bacterium]
MQRVFISIALAASLTACSVDTPDDLRLKANEAIAIGEWRTAEIHLKNLLQKDGNDGEARLQLAQIYEAQNNMASAEKELRRADELGIDSDRIALPLLKAMSVTSTPQELLDEVARRNSTDAAVQTGVLYYSAAAQRQLGKSDEAIATLNQALELDPESLKVQISLLELQGLQSDSQRRQSIAKLAELSTQHPEDISVLLVQGDLLRLDQQLDEARQTFERAQELSPDNIATLVRLAALHVAQTQFDSAAPYVEQGLKSAPNYPMLLSLQAQIDYAAKRFPTAINNAEKALSVLPDYVPAVAVAAAAALANGSIERAETYANQLRQLAPESVDSYRLLGAILMAKGKSAEVLDLLGPVISQGIQDPTILSLAGQASMQSNNPAEAKRFLEKAVEFDVNSSNARLHLAIAKISSGDDIGGIDELETAADLDPDSPRANYALISQLIRAKDFDRADQAIAKLEEKQPGKAENRYMAGLLALAKKDNAAARTQFNKALEINDRFLSATAKLASLDIAEGRKDVAIKRFSDVLAKQPDNELALLALARITLAENPQSEEGLEYIKRAREANPTSTKPTVLLAAYQMRNNQPNKAISSLRDGLTDNPENPVLLEALAKAQRASGATEDALLTIDKLTSLEPDNAAIQFRMGSLRAAMADFRGALLAFRSAQRIAPKSIGPRLGAAMVHVRMGNSGEAFAVARTLKSDMPEKAAGWVLEGEIHRAAQQWNEAANAYVKGFELEPDRLAILYKADGALRRAGKQEQANQKLASVLKAQPENATLQRYAGDLESSRKNYKQAIKHYEKAVSLAPGDGVSWNNLAWTQHQVGDKNAITSASRAMELEPQSAPTLDTVATILADDGQVERAISIQQDAVKISPANPDYRLRLAKLLKKNGQTDLARTELESLLTQNSAGKQADEARDLLKSF